MFTQDVPTVALAFSDPSSLFSQEVPILAPFPGHSEL